jgi:hypothetical protein
MKQHTFEAFLTRAILWTSLASMAPAMPPRDPDEAEENEEHDEEEDDALEPAVVREPDED